MHHKLRRRVLDRANLHLRELAGASPAQALSYMGEVAKRAEVLVAVWNEGGPGSGTTLHHIVVKGGADLTLAQVRSALRRDVVEGLACRHRFEAEAMNDALGDGSTVVENYAPTPPEVAPHLDRLRAEAAAEAEHLDELVDMANATGDLIKSGATTYEDVFKAAEVIHLIWQDRSRPHGIGQLLAKGQDRLKLLVDSGKAADLKFTSIRCRDAVHAHALRQLYGDGR
ncbi:hypothetical protein [Enterovirga aerilata]|uniref:Uncharacterized protein n=1 Tax=Enterovirga aerilata TaxID=2730920 RepID=A0A849I951_9HYPH|nr:hypothetical protein [Enterovirga sp. DB1703]NNM73841.1 hypothetical protein [Enterovirga sp. DB1703]